jgi:hypothetical protein
MIAPKGTVKTTDGATTVMPVKSNGEGNLPRTHVVYKDASDAEQATTGYYTEFDGDELYPDTVIPRREIKYVGGTGTGLYASLDGLGDDTLPAVPIPLNLKFGWAAGNGDTTSVDRDIRRSGHLRHLYANGHQRHDHIFQERRCLCCPIRIDHLGGERHHCRSPYHHH